jgi:hypothetical protein
MVARELREKLNGVPDDYEVAFHLNSTFDLDVEYEDDTEERIENVTIDDDVDFDGVESEGGKVTINLT